MKKLNPYKQLKENKKSLNQQMKVVNNMLGEQAIKLAKLGPDKKAIQEEDRQI